MFKTRVRLLLVLFGLGWAAVAVRLTQLQIADAHLYQRRAEQSVILRPTPLPFVRGRILDRQGEVLAADEPCWDVKLDFAVIAADIGGDAAARNLLIRDCRRRGSYPGLSESDAIGAALDDDLRAMWSALADYAAQWGTTSADRLRDQAATLYDKIARVRRTVAARRGYDAPVAEEVIAHPLLTGLDADQQIAAREHFAPWPWIHVEPSSMRRYTGDGYAFAHLLGRLGRVDAEVVAADPQAGDPFAEYRGDELLGISGVEWAAEDQLRGRRGQMAIDRDGQLVAESFVEPEHGEGVQLTIDAGLQRRLFDLLGESVDALPESSGGAIVVLDVPTREVLALVSYPAYDPNDFDAAYAQLADDTERLPLWFRAVGSRYAPGSTIKPLVCMAGLTNRLISLDSREHCSGYLLPEHRDRWRCWPIHGTSQRMAHGSIDVVEALTGSCNIFLYRLGEDLGAHRLCAAFDMAGIGRASGMGLREENAGINPTPAWLMRNKNQSVTPGTARLFAIGQGEVSMTPVQVANLLATYAAGSLRPVTLVRSATPTPEWFLPGTAEEWRAIRRGMYGVVNDPDGTAYKYARFVHDRVAMVGKTGSATAYPWPTAFRVTYIDSDGNERAGIVPAGSRDDALARFALRYPGAAHVESIDIARRWPPHPPLEGENFAHAWFGGFLQPLGADGRPDWSRTPGLAFAVLVEFGGSGGRITGPLGKAVAKELVDRYGPDLRIDPGRKVAVRP